MTGMHAVQRCALNIHTQTCQERAEEPARSHCLSAQRASPCTRIDGGQAHQQTPGWLA